MFKFKQILKSFLLVNSEDFNPDKHNVCPDCEGLQIDDMGRCLTCKGNGWVEKSS